MSRALIHITLKDNTRLTIFSRSLNEICKTLKDILLEEFPIKVKQISYNDQFANEVKFGYNDREDNLTGIFVFTYEGKPIPDGDYTTMFTDYYIERFDMRIKKVIIENIE